jgi:hypothetical protein
MKLKNVAKIPRYVVDNENFVYTMEEGKLQRRKVDLVAIQGNEAIIKKSNDNDMKIITTILQKPLIGMQVKSVNESIELNDESTADKDSGHLSKAY